MSAKRRTRHGPVNIVCQLHDAGAMWSAGNILVAELQGLNVNEATCHRWRNRHRRPGLVRLKEVGGGQAARAPRRREPTPHVVDQTRDTHMLKHVASANPPCGLVGAAVKSAAHSLLLTPAERWDAAPPFAEACGDP